ncbi:hypothetical protein VZT92_007117 [Zoarces viviparus]|uniref:Uncharacterized protein n=1 Tax=Zoarces viviparus TaxID=48416 RepID=A0AAW1FJS3_ZOAVI
MDVWCGESRGRLPPCLESSRLRTVSHQGKQVASMNKQTRSFSDRAASSPEALPWCRWFGKAGHGSSLRHAA